MTELKSTDQNDKALMDSLSNLAIRLYPENSACLICGGETNLLKTDSKTCYSFDLGKFKLISGCNYCADHKYFDKSGQIIRYESDLAAMIVDKGYRVTFDLVVKVGRLRYDDHRQLREIQAYLKCSSAKIDLPLSTISLICKRFLEFCQKLHTSREDDIRRDINSNGGYILHFDGSTEQKCGRCNLVLIDSRSGHILESSMVKSESCATIKEALKGILAKYGQPLVVVSDLRSGFVSSCIEVFGKKVKHILCHYHFLRTFKDEFNNDHQFLKTCMTHKWQLQAGLTKQLKALQNLKAKGNFSKELKTINKVEEYWDKTGDTLGAYRHALRWILNYKQDSSGKGLPFDLPFLDLFHRVQSGKDLIEKIFANASGEMRMKYYLHGFCRILDKTNNLGANEKGFRKALRSLEFGRKWFDKLRAVLFLEAQLEEDRPLAPLSKQYRLTAEEAKRIPLRLSGFLNSVKRDLMHCKHSDRKAFLENLKKQIEKYRGNLHVPLLSVNIDGKEVFFVPPRTNNCLESIFRLVKTLLRRCTGRSKLPKEFGSIGATLTYYLLMKDHPTFREIFNDDRKLTEEFAKLFVKSWQPQENLAALSSKPTIVPDERQIATLCG
ncbi:MAG: hypothetical protein GY800_04000 [Planctomycetes bacterium]|nr:hypothetical protein [Planctomycetota bacterium]